MKLDNVGITILFSDDGLKIEFYDSDSVSHFLTAELDRKQTCQALSRLSQTPCSVEVFGLGRIGLKREMDYLHFSDDRLKVYGKDRKEVAQEIAKSLCPEGWIVYDSFSSRDSFTYGGDGKVTAHCMIVRWVEKEKKDA